MPIRTMLKRRVEHAELAREHAHLAGDLAGGQVAVDAHLAGQAEGAAHRAADLGRDAEGLRRRVGDEDRLDQLAVGEPQQELRRAVGRAFRCDDSRRARSSNSLGQLRRAARAPRSVIAAKSVTPRLWIHRKIWRAWKRGRAEASSAASSVGQFELGEVGARGRCVHGGVRRGGGENSHCTMPPPSTHARRRSRSVPPCLNGVQSRVISSGLRGACVRSQTAPQLHATQSAIAWSFAKSSTTVSGSSPRRCRTCGR